MWIIDKESSERTDNFVVESVLGISITVIGLFTSFCDSFTLESIADEEGIVFQLSMYLERKSPKNLQCIQVKVWSKTISLVSRFSELSEVAADWIALYTSQVHFKRNVSESDSDCFCVTWTKDVRDSDPVDEL